MAWFVGRSVVIIVLAFVLGLVVGWWWWRRRKVRFGESPTISQLTTTHQTQVAELTKAVALKDEELHAKDAEVARLHAEAEQSAAPTSGVSSGSATWRVEEPVAATLAAEPTEPSPETLAALATPVEEIATEEHQTPADVPEFLVQTLAADVADASEGDDAADVEVAEPVVEDDLERVEGIGPRIGAVLRTAGIHSFQQLADAETATLQAALEQAGLRFAPSLPTWSRQARLLADGDEEGFVALTQQLVGGRDVSGATR